MDTSYGEVTAATLVRKRSLIKKNVQLRLLENNMFGHSNAFSFLSISNRLQIPRARVQIPSFETGPVVTYTLA